MSALNFTEIQLLESFFERREVEWCGTHRTLDRLFRHQKVEETEGFDAGAFAMLSKRDKWEWVWENCENETTFEVTTLALEEWKRLLEEEPNGPLLAGYQRCLETVKSLVLSEGEEEVTVQEPHFNHQKPLLIEDLKEAKLGIWVCMYLFNDWEIAKTLIQKAKEGVTLDLIVQDDEKNRRQPFWTEIEKHASVLWWYPDAKGINHHKFCIIDTRSVWHGSFNFTRAAATRNRECLSRDTNRITIDRFAEEFKDVKRYLLTEQQTRKLIDW